MTRDDVRAKFIIELDQGELAVRLIEASLEVSRPPGKSVSQCLAGVPDVEFRQFLRMADAAIAWFAECSNKGTRPS